MIGDVVAWVVELFVGSGVATGTGKHHERVARGEGKVVGALRVRAGEASGLSRRWRAVEIQPRAGVLAFDLTRLTVVRAFLRPGPLPLGQTIGVPVTSDPALIDVHVEGATLELAVPEVDAAQVMQALRPGDGG